MGRSVAGATSIISCARTEFRSKFAIVKSHIKGLLRISGPIIHRAIIDDYNYTSLWI